MTGRRTVDGHAEPRFRARSGSRPAHTYDSRTEPGERTRWRSRTRARISARSASCAGGRVDRRPPSRLCDLVPRRKEGRVGVSAWSPGSSEAHAARRDARLFRETGPPMSAASYEMTAASPCRSRATPRWRVMHRDRCFDADCCFAPVTSHRWPQRRRRQTVTLGVTETCARTRILKSLAK